jgi:hypothetical protein
MNKSFATMFAIGIGVIAVVVAGVLFMQRGARVAITGSILKVRTAALDENSSVAVLDFRFSNPANVNFVVRSVKVVLEEPSGAQYEGQTVSELDAKRLFEGMPLLGQKFNETLLMRDKIPAHTAEDRMVAARFEAPETRLLARKRFLLRVEDVDGPISEIAENK